MSAQKTVEPSRARSLLQGLTGVAMLAVAIALALALIAGVTSVINKLESGAVRDLVCTTTHCLNLHPQYLHTFTPPTFTTPTFTTPTFTTPSFTQTGP